MQNNITDIGLYIAGAALFSSVIFSLAINEISRRRDKRLEELEKVEQIEELARRMVLVRKAKKLAPKIEELDRLRSAPRKWRKAISAYPNSNNPKTGT